MNSRILVFFILAYGVLSAVLYSSLLPLWEGFDEPFHYGYVQTIADRGSFPVFGQVRLSDEIWESIKLAPASHVVKQNIPIVMTFAEYFQLTSAERRTLRSRLDGLDPSLRNTDLSGPSNYEVQHAPASYLILAAFDHGWRNVVLPVRVWRLRLVCSVAACLLLWFATTGLAEALEIPQALRPPLLFVVFTSQMFYASAAHVANDWLSIPVSALLFYATVSVWREPTVRRIIVMALTLAVGLLTKAYFLSLLPAVAVFVVWMLLKGRLSGRRAVLFVVLASGLSGPWYVRNVILHHSLSGMQESVGGVGLAQFWASMWRLPVFSSALMLARRALWTGNNSDLAFSSATINLMLVLLLIVALVYAATATRRRPPDSEWILLGGIVAFGLGLFYVTVMNFAYTEGAAKATGPWHTQPLFVPGFCLLFAGLSRARRVGRILASILVCLWGYVAFATYWIKLIPLYAGWGQGGVQPRALVSWYLKNWSGITDNLSTVALAQPGFVLSLAAAVGIAALGAPALLSWTLLRRRAREDT